MGREGHVEVVEQHRKEYSYLLKYSTNKNGQKNGMQLICDDDGNIPDLSTCHFSFDTFLSLGVKWLSRVTVQRFSEHEYQRLIQLVKD